jgi:hypothetical protein
LESWKINSRHCVFNLPLEPHPQSLFSVLLFFKFGFQIWSLALTLPRVVLDHGPPTSTFWVVGIIIVSQHRWHLFEYFMIPFFSLSCYINDTFLISLFLCQISSFLSIPQYSSLESPYLVAFSNRTYCFCLGSLLTGMSIGCQGQEQLSYFIIKFLNLFLTEI